MGVFRTLLKLSIVVVFLLSMTLNIATFSVGAFATAISATVAAVTGVKTVAARFLAKSDEATKLSNELKVSRKAAAQQSARLEKELAEKAAIKAEVAELRAAKRVVYEGVEMTVPEAVTRTTSRIRARTAKLAATDLSATFGQSIPWIGVGVVVVATAYDLKMACETMRDMRAIDLTVNPQAEDDPDIERVCGMRVPTEEEIWTAIKSSPGAIWDAAKGALDGLPRMPEMPEFDWPSLPEIGMPSVPDINWTFWK